MGIPFHGEFSSADASALTEANSRFTLYPAGSKVAIGGAGVPAVLGSEDYAVVTDLELDFTGATTRVITIYDGADATVDGGEKIHEVSMAQNAHHTNRPLAPYTCQKGTYPKVKAGGGGQFTALIRGYITRGP